MSEVQRVLTTPRTARASSPTARSRRKALAFDPHINSTPEYMLFPPPHQGRAIQNVVFIYNTADQPCVYKLRSQNPARYVARPNVAVVAPKSATRIKVTLCVSKTEGNIPPETQERFRISVKMLGSAPADLADASEDRASGPRQPWYAKMESKEIWSRCPTPICHEKDIIAYFRPDMPLPSGGMVTYLDESQVPVTDKKRLSLSKAKESMSQLPPSRAQSPSRRATLTEESPQPSRQLDFDEGAAQEVATAPERRRSWKGFVWMALLAIVVAYGIGLAVRVYGEITPSDDFGHMAARSE